MRSKLLLAGLLSLIASSAFASDACRSAKDLVKLGQNFYGADPDLTNVIAPAVTMRFEGVNGAETPTAILYRHGDEEDILPVIDGELTGLERLANWSKDGEMCRMIGDELSPAAEGDKIRVQVSFSFEYKRRDGVFSVDELKEGAKDGSKMMKGLAPGGLGFVVPGLKAVSLTAADGVEIQPTYEFSRKGEPVSVDSSQSGSTTLIRLKDIKSAKADVLNIEGEYRLTAIFKFDPEDIERAEAERLGKEAQAEN